MSVEAKVGNSPEWRVFLIGGSSGIGKTLAGRRLAQRYGFSLLLVDDVRMAIQAVTMPSEQTALHTFIMAGTDAMRSPESVCAGLVLVAEAIEPALRMIMAHHLVVEGAGPIVIEGDGILPRLASASYLSTQPEFRDMNLEEAVNGVILFEEDHTVIQDSMLARGRGYQNKTAVEQHALSEGSCLFGRYLFSQAKEFGISVLPSRPFETLFERVLRVTSL